MAARQANKLALYRIAEAAGMSFRKSWTTHELVCALVAHCTVMKCKLQKLHATCPEAFPARSSLVER